ncbi:uncharacterized protein OCT59_019688 [Rhizophagus irregularis]|uniref:uncharacterized protein n=1 Tax=Rhizophagus irregularis TaxID=588596 RepID=UPI000CAB3B98|nr:hypothetical protein OCT59_019688 [Rhizophagus irregularis]
MSKSLTFKDNLFTAVGIKVRKDGLDSGYVRLKCGENLSNIRQELEKYSLINDTLLFAKGTSEIHRRSERDFLIDSIIEGKDDDYKFINLKKNPSHDYDLNILKVDLQLEHGRKIISDGKIKIAKKNAFILDVADFEVCKEKGIGTERKEFNSSEYNKSITELTLNGGINAQGFAKFGLSYGKSKNVTSGVEKITICHYIHVDKISLKFKSDEKLCFEPTEEFKDEIDNAIRIDKHKDRLDKFKEITENFGQFISNEVLLGGRAYFLGEENLGKFSEEKNKNVSTTVEAMSSNAEMTHTSGKLTENANYSKKECFELIGEYKKPVSIFRPLSYELREKIFKSIGKRILYNDPGEDYFCKPNERNVFVLKNIPTYIADIIKNKDAECNIFATVIDTDNSRNDFFNCQILWTPNKNPKLIIHCIQHSLYSVFKKSYNLKIGLMVVGYDINFDFINSDSNIHFEVIENKIGASKSMYCKKLFDDSFTEEYKEYEEHICLGIPVLSELKPSHKFLVIGHHFSNYQENNRIGTYTFSYCLKKNHYVELPEFTFHTLIISNYHNFDEYNEYPSNQVIPKYTSLHSSEDNWAPIFLKQKQDEIKIKYMKCKGNCKDTCTCICKKTLKDDHKLHSLIILETQHENNWKILRA